MKSAFTILRHLYSGDLYRHTPVRSLAGQAAGFFLILLSNALGLLATRPATAVGSLLWVVWAVVTGWLLLVVILTGENLRRRLTRTTRTTR